MITKMTRYDFILLSGETDAFLKEIQELGVVDITRESKPVDETSSAMVDEIESLRNKISGLEKSIYKFDSEYVELAASVSDWKDEVTKRKIWGEFSSEKISSLEADGLKLRFYCVSAKKFDEAWGEIQAMQVIETGNDKVWFVTVCPVTEEYSFPVEECPAPTGSVNEAEASLKDAEARLRKREKELKAINISTLKSEYEQKLRDLDLYFANKSAESAAENTLSVITGFAPAANNAVLKSKFDAMDIYYMSGKADIVDNPPIKLKNNKYVSMFEVLTDMYGRPKYDGFDPTPFISIFFLLFFAMCMGDAGYGLILVIASLLLRKKPGLGSAAPLVLSLGIATVFVGTYFHTFFSFDMREWFPNPDEVAKYMVPDNVGGKYEGTMVLSLIVGIIHLCLAMIVKTVVATKNKGFLGSLETWGWTLLIVGGVIVGTIALAGVIDSHVTKIVIIALGCLSALGIFFLNDIHRNPLKNVGAGLWATYETSTGLLGDILSYLRLYALGLAGGMLGKAFNDLAFMTLGNGGFEDGGLGWISYVLIAVIGHALNIAMAALGAFVHPLRLNFLEFFKNSGYDGSGRKYKPLQKQINN